MKFFSEDQIHDLIVNNEIVQDGIKQALNFSEDLKFIHEDVYINGITADFTLISDNTIVAIMECKSGKINLTDYVRGIGQLLQYEYFFEENIPHNSLKYDQNIKTIYLYPSSVIKNNQFNIGNFKYPYSTVIFELNEFNKSIRVISKEELKKLKSIENNNLLAISQYYFRDNRLFEYYMLILYIRYEEMKGSTNIDRNISEDILKEIKTINNNNWRNAFITLSHLGLINRKNLLTEAGRKMSILNYEDFAVTLFHSYLEPYFKEIIDCFKEKELNYSNLDFCENIRKKYNGKDILYLTQSSGRYISSWLNIMKDDYGMISFEKRSKKRRLNYNPFEINEEKFKEIIKENSNAYEYIEKFYGII